MLRLIAALALAAVVLLAWTGGELHRQNCIDTGRDSCSVLPWDNGVAFEPPPPCTPSFGGPRPW